MLTAKIINEIKQRLIALYNPVEIYLFGSYAWGSPDDESDLDLLIVVDECDPQKRYAVMAKGHHALLDMRNVATDIVVLSKEEFDDVSNDPVRMFYNIRHKGKKIYARA